tara:strand:+ start:2794 stop:3453 length:660 start_codon:yes stop_codon:yes gene_type:complete
MKICFIAKLSKPYASQSIDSLQKLSNNIDIYDCESLKEIPYNLSTNKYDIIFSYISSWILSKEVLNRTKRWNINLHPGPPEYPGTGCFNFAIYDSAKKYGATAHEMNPNVDTGKIIKVKRFSMSENETVDTLSKKTYKSLNDVFISIVNHISNRDSLPISKERWLRKPFKRTDLEKLATIDFKMSKSEIDKRIRATYLPGKPAPFIKLNKHKFEYNPDR